MLEQRDHVHVALDHHHGGRLESGREYDGVAVEIDYLARCAMRDAQACDVVGLVEVGDLGGAVYEEAAIARYALGVLASVEVLDQYRIDSRVIRAAVVLEQTVAPRRFGREVLVDGLGVEDAVGTRLLAVLSPSTNRILY